MWMRVGAAHNISFIFKDLRMNIEKHQLLHIKIYIIKQDINKNTKKFPYPLLEQPYLDPRILLSEVCVDFGPLVDYLPDFRLGHQWEGEVRSRMEAHDLAGPVSRGGLKQRVRVRS